MRLAFQCSGGGSSSSRNCQSRARDSVYTRGVKQEGERRDSIRSRDTQNICMRGSDPGLGTGKRVPRPKRRGRRLKGTGREIESRKSVKWAKKVRTSQQDSIMDAINANLISGQWQKMRAMWWQRGEWDGAFLLREKEGGREGGRRREEEWGRRWWRQMPRGEMEIERWDRLSKGNLRYTCCELDGKAGRPTALSLSLPEFDSSSGRF